MAPTKVPRYTGYRTLEDIQAEARDRRLRLAFFVTALPLELVAVRAHLTDMGAVRAPDGTIFECGTFADRGQDWVIIMGETRAGTHNAQQVVSTGHFAFQKLGKFELMIFVGIGGSRKKGAPIGSVVAADKVYYPYGGKFTGGTFSNRPDARVMDHELVNIAQKICRDELWPSRIIAAKLHLDLGDRASPVTLPPRAKVAPIASIEAVLDDPKSELEALLKSSYGDTHIVEMEGYGAIFAAHTVRTPGMIIRGVSDMTHEKSDDDDDVYQPIAATHAAAFAFEILSHWGMHNDAPDLGDRLVTTISGKDVETAMLVGSEESSAGVVAGYGMEAAATSEPPLIALDQSAKSEPAYLKLEISVVLKLSADFGPENRERLDRLEQTLRGITGSQMIEIVDAHAGSLLLFVADPENALSKTGLKRLREALLERENVEFVGMAGIKSYRRRDEQIADLDAASGDLLTWSTSLPDGQTLDRPELTDLSARIAASSSSATALIGPPGAGKSALLAMLGRSFRASGWPVLAIKSDLLDPDISSESDLRDRLGLQQTPSTILCDLASLGPVLLIVDQLDALAGYLDVKTARLSILLNLVRRLARIDNIHIVISSRIFEFEHDVRLRAVSAESLTLKLPPWSEVLAVLDTRGVAAAGWPPDAQEVMRSPQALATYLLLNSRYSSESFTSYQLMLERLWEERVLAGRRGGERDRLASDIADAMAEQESLWLAASRFADRTTEMQALTAAGILTTLDASVGFSHQTLFEFTLARSFAREPGRLSSFATDRQNSLFLRPKLWAGLTYLRGADRNLYHQELEAIWRTDDLRAHLRMLLIDFVGSQSDPSDREALLMGTALTKDTTRLHAFRLLGGSRGWFDRFADSYIATAMRSNGRLADAQVDVLTRALPSAPTKVAELIQGYWLPQPANDLRTWSVIQWSSPWTNEALAIALTVLGRTDIASSIIDHQTGVIGMEQPVIALQLVLARLNRQLDVAIEKAQALADAAEPQPADPTDDEQLTRRLKKLNWDPVRKLIEQNGEWDSLSGIAEKWPQETLNSLFPWFIRALEVLDQRTDRGVRVGYPLGLEADYRFDAEKNLELPKGAVLDALRVAVEGLADASPDAFRQWINACEGIGLTPVQRLIAHGIAHRPETFAEAGLNFVLGDERRYFLGSLHDLHSTIKRMIAAVSHHWRPDQIQRFEERIRSFSPPPPADETEPKSRMFWRHMMRRTQLDLLRALPAHQRSTQASRQVIEDERRYGSERRGVSFDGGIIGSIIEPEEMMKASDDDIINAFVTLPDATGWDNPRSWMAGGNVQLARAFATFAKDHVDRSIRILRRLNRDNGVRAAAYAIDALSEGAPSATIFDLVRDLVARGFNSEEFRHSVAHALERMARQKVDIDEDLLTLLESWIANPPAPDQSDDERGGEASISTSETEDNEDNDGETAINRSLLWGYNGSGAFPGGNVPIADALVHIRLLRQEPDNALEFLSDYLVREKGVRAWEILARYLPYLGKTDPGKREAFLERMLTEVRGAAGSKQFAQVLAGAQQENHSLVERHIDAWRNASLRAARQAYGEIVGLDALLHPEHEASCRRLQEIVSSSEELPAQVGAALSAAHVFAEEPDRRAEAARLLTELLALPNPDVWTATFDLFRLTNELVPDEATAAILRAIIDGLPRSPNLNPTFVVDRLASLLPHLAPLVGEVALGLVAKWNAELADVRTSTAMAASALIDLAITLHRLGPETREIGLTLFEQLIDIDAYEARLMLDEIDNRFRAISPFVRKRVRRRSEVMAKRLR